jgi:single-strand DNA-binding protein
MLRTEFIGHLRAAPELRHSQKGAPIVTFRVAVNQLRTGADGDRQERTEWFRVRVMGPRTEYAQRLAKGARVFVVGRLDISHYESRDGEQRVGFDVWADECQNLTPRPGEERATHSDAHSQATGDASGHGSASADQGVAQAGSASEAAESHLEDLPF